MQNKTILDESFRFKFFREFTTHTAFLAFPLISEIVSSGIFKLISPIHLFLFIWLFIQTYFIVTIKQISLFKIFFLHSWVPLVYLLFEYLSWWNIFTDKIYVLYFIFILLNTLFRGLEFYLKDQKNNFNLYIRPIDISIKLLIIPIFYFLLELTNKPNLEFFSFYFSGNSPTHGFLFFIFIYLAFIFSIDIYLSEKRKKVLDNLLWILHKYSSYIVDSNDLEESIKNGKINMSSKKIYKTVVFMDIRWFTHWSENNKPEEVINLLNWFYRVAEEMILHYKSGKINKYVADEIVFVFDDLDDAIDFSLELKEKEIEYLKKFDLKIWFWINAWVLIYGWIGWDFKKEQTVIWDVVNVAARLEWWVNQIKIPKSIAPNRYHTNDLWPINLKWKSSTMEVVEIISKK